jgi:hypothetical protein
VPRETGMTRDSCRLEDVDGNGEQVEHVHESGSEMEPATHRQRAHAGGMPLTPDIRPPRKTLRRVLTDLPTRGSSGV